MKERKKHRKYIALHLILIIFLSNLFLDNVIAEDPDYIEFPAGQSSTVTVIDDRDLKIESALSFFNPSDKQQRFKGDIEIPWMFRQGDGEVYGVNDTSWVTMPKDSINLHFESDAPPFTSHEIIFRVVLNDKVNKTDNNYKFAWEYSAINFSFQKVEFRIPLKKCFKRLDIRYSIAPDSEYDSSKYRIVRWEQALQSQITGAAGGVISVNYSYKIPWGEYSGTALLIILTAVVTLGIEHGFLYINKRVKKKDRKKFKEK